MVPAFTSIVGCLPVYWRSGVGIWILVMCLVDAHASHRIQGIGNSRTWMRGEHQPISILSSTSFLPASSLPTNSNELVVTALPFSTLVITYEHPNQWASAKSVADQRAG